MAKRALDEPFFFFLEYEFIKGDAGINKNLREYGEKGKLNKTMSEVLPVFSQGLQHYREQKWVEALNCFEKVLEINEKDGPALTFSQRCIMFQNKPPAEDWDGIFSMTSK